MYARAFLLLFFFITIFASGQNSAESVRDDSVVYAEKPRKFFSDDKWQDAKNGIEYESDKQKENEKNGPAFGLPFLNPELLKYFFFILIFVALIAFIVWLTRRLNPKMPSKTKDFEITATESLTKDELMLLDLENSIAEAIRHKDFYLATRLLYLKVLQQLIANEIIEWRKDITNRHILNQLTDQTQLFKLRGIFRQYENVWYGQKNISETDFEDFLSKCNQFSANLKQTIER